MSQMERSREMEWSVDAGTVRLTYPPTIRDDEVDDLEALFALTIKMMRRRASEIATRRAEEE